MRAVKVDERSPNCCCAEEAALGLSLGGSVGTLPCFDLEEAVVLVAVEGEVEGLSKPSSSVMACSDFDEASWASSSESPPPNAVLRLGGWALAGPGFFLFRLSPKESGLLMVGWRNCCWEESEETLKKLETGYCGKAAQLEVAPLRRLGPDPFNP